jgi:hypothetical protein
MNMNFDDYDAGEYEEVLPRDKEFTAWLGSIEKDYAKVTAKLNVDDDIKIHCDSEDSVEDDEEF